MTTATQQEAERLIEHFGYRVAIYGIATHSINRKQADDARTALLTFIAGLVEDAERYRYLRDNSWPKQLMSVVSLQQNALWDTAIDAARKEKT